jgi:hypothetical protein
VTGRGTWGPARRARCRAPGANAPHAGARARGGGWCAGYAETESQSARRSREPGARRAACAPGAGAARALRRSREARAASPSREARAARDDRARVLARTGGRARARASDVTSRAVSEGDAIQAEAPRIRVSTASSSKRNAPRLVTKVDQFSYPFSGSLFLLTALPKTRETGAGPHSTAYSDPACTKAPVRQLPRSLSFRICWENEGGALYRTQEVDGSISFSSTIPARPGALWDDDPGLAGPRPGAPPEIALRPGGGTRSRRVSQRPAETGHHEAR